MGKPHLLTIVAYPAVPVPGLEESEPDEDVVDPEVVDPEVVDSEVVAPGLLEDFVGCGRPGYDGGLHGNGAENVLRAKRPIVIRAVVADLKERILGNDFST